MNDQNPPQEPDHHLDLTSEPPALSTSSPKELKQIRRSSRTQRVSFYFGCCRVYATLTPPEHVLRGDADIWRAHCPRCGGLTEVLFQ